MPLYEYECKRCGRVECRNARVRERDNQLCRCGARMCRLMSKPEIVVPSYFHTSFSEIGPVNEEQERDWREHAIPKSKGYRRIETD